MVDLTIVSCLAPCLLGGRDREEATRLFQPLLDAGVPLVVYVEDAWKDALQARCPSASTRLHETSAGRRREAFAMRAELEAACAAATTSHLPAFDFFVTTLTKMGMLHDQSIWNPFGTRHLAWIDPDVAASVHPRTFTAERVFDSLPALLSRFLLLTRPSPVADAARTPAASRVQTQLFGGRLEDIGHCNALYYQLLEHLLRSGELPTDESIFTRLLEGEPERFDRFVLQDNGLAGFFFEALRSGRVSIECTKVYPRRCADGRPADDLTLVTALFDLGRGAVVENLSAGFVRPFDAYLESFSRLLRAAAPMSIYIEPRHEEFVWRHRAPQNTRVFAQSTDRLRNAFPFFAEVQKIRRDPAWRARAGWLAESPQANLELYNPLVMSKLGMVHDQSIINPFGTDRFLWVDAGIASTCGAYLEDPAWPARIRPLLEKFLFLCFPYEGADEIHGFDRRAMAHFARTDDVRWVARGGLFGGRREAIARANRLYYRLLEVSLQQGEMGTEESVFSIMAYREPESYDRFLLPEDGLILHFLDRLLRGPVPVVTAEVVDVSPPPAAAAAPRPRAFDPGAVDLGRLSTALYVVTFNSPPQLRLLLESWAACPQLLGETARYLIDNSTDARTTPEYAEICAQYGFEHLKRDNVGICGARQLAADHFAAGAHDYMFFFEDDMLAHPAGGGLCPNGFPTWVDGLYEKTLLIMEKEGFDFLKLSFAEAHGDNSQQWAWYNVPARVRRDLWPELPMLPQEGLAEAIPATRFERIGSVGGLAYACGEVYYANWPQIVGREGNRRMFLEVRWAHPFEQTWMSHLFQLSRSGQLRGAVLLASPVRHCRVHHYERTERRES